MREFFDWVNYGGKTHSECAWCHSTGQGSHLGQGCGIQAEALCFLTAEARGSAVVPLSGCLDVVKSEEPVGSAGSRAGWDRVRGRGDLWQLSFVVLLR